jgi:Na+-translocating ferredoxin:NAD+ oxidoreductase RnfG subunit
MSVKNTEESLTPGVWITLIVAIAVTLMTAIVVFTATNVQMAKQGLQQCKIANQILWQKKCKE